MFEMFPQGLPFDTLGDEVGRPVNIADLVDSDDVGVIESRDRAGLLLEPSDPVRIFRTVSAGVLSQLCV